METLEQITQRLGAIADELQALGSKPDLTAEDGKRCEELEKESDGLILRQKRLAKVAEIRGASQVSVGDSRLCRPTDRRAAPEDRVDGAPEFAMTVPARPFRYGSLRGFKGPNADERAYRFGMWCAGSMAIAAGAIEHWTVKKGQRLNIRYTRAQGEDVNTAGGFIVLPEFDRDIIELIETYGAFRRNAKIRPMASDIKHIPRRTGGVTAYFAGEGEAGTESDKTWDDVQLIARKLFALTKYSSELAEDAIINIGDDLAVEFGRAFAYKEDLCGFNGTGAGTYGTIVGLGPRFTNLNGVDEGGGIIVGTGELATELTLADFNKTVALLPAYADGPDAKWYCHRYLWAAAMQRLEQAAGGVTATELVNGTRVRSFLGYPVEFVQVMDSGGVASAWSKPLAFLGDLTMAADMGVRRGMSVQFSGSALNSFEQDQVAARGTERFDINVHDIGTAAAAGPVVCLLGKAS